VPSISVDQFEDAQNGGLVILGRDEVEIAVARRRAEMGIAP
jgi:hypothetical protein